MGIARSSGDATKRMGTKKKPVKKRKYDNFLRRGFLKCVISLSLLAILSPSIFLSPNKSSSEDLFEFSPLKNRISIFMLRMPRIMTIDVKDNHTKGTG
jgi:hypothetical protein